MTMVIEMDQTTKQRPTQPQLPNGLLRWFGFDFDRVDLPDGPILYRSERPVWEGYLPGFVHRASIVDAKATIEVMEFRPDGDQDEEDEAAVSPKEYRVALDAHGFDRAQEFTATTWQEVQERCRRAERDLDDTYHERHHLCYDEEGNLSGDACSFCETGVPGN